VVEDNEVYAKAVRHHLSLNPDNEVEVFHTGKACVEQLYQNPQLIFLDYSLPDQSGIEVLQRIQKLRNPIPVIIVSGQEDVSTAVELLKEGAYDYIVKDENARERMWKAVNNIRENAQLRSEIDKLREEVNLKYDLSNIKGSSPQIQKVFKLIEKAAQTNINVTITGETGTGKELVAKAIHYNSRLQKRSLVTVNVAAIPRDLLESELFGHEKGAFTGAISRRVGKFEEANGGTLFLDEIGEMDINLQAKLLRVVQEKELTRIGSNQVIKIDARILVATHRNLAEEVKKGTFREDLYYRLLGLPIELPPLRERGKDILVLAQFFLDQFSKENKLGKVSLAKASQNKLLQYHWPGNVRELKAVMELAAVLGDGNHIQPEDINFNAAGAKEQAFIREGVSLKEYNRLIVQHYLDKYDQNVVEVARKLEVGKSTIYRMIKNGEVSIKNS